jgi:hypothetical protein
MSTSEEQSQILAMVENRTLTASEGTLLLEASEARPVQNGRAVPTQSRWIRVRVTDLATGRNKINVSIPIELVDIGLRMGAKFTPEMSGVDIHEMLGAIRNGAGGLLVDIEDADKGEHIEIHAE